MIGSSTLAGGFDTTTAGTFEGEWRAALACVPPWEPEPGPLIVVAPHPDDETLGAGGLIATWARRGFEVRIISVSDGEAESTRADLAATRRAELDRAVARLGLTEDRVRRLQLPDGELARHERDIARGVLDEVTKGATLVAPCEGDGHPDHEAVARACRRVATSSGLPLVGYPIWAWFNESPPWLFHRELGRFELDGRAQLDKSRAVRCYQSQTSPAVGEPTVPEHVLSYFQRPFEVFIR